MAQIHLLPEEVLIKTGPVDHADWNFRPILGAIQRARFRLALSLLGENRFERLLEIGYGSGVFMPELARHCHELSGVDVHDRGHLVSEALSKLDIQASLVSASAERMPFADLSFDAVVAVSSFEFIEQLDDACREIRRVLKPNGVFVVITPGHSPLVDFGLRVMTGESPRRDYGDRRNNVMAALRRHFRVEESRTLPPRAPSSVCLYRGLKLVFREDGGRTTST